MIILYPPAHFVIRETVTGVAPKFVNGNLKRQAISRSIVDDTIVLAPEGFERLETIISGLDYQWIPIPGRL